MEKENIGEKALEFINKLIELGGLKCTATLEDAPEKTRIVISGEHSGIMIGRRGDALDAVQYLTMLVSSQGDDFKKIVVDTENYRQKREATLINLAHRLAEKADRLGKDVRLEPMNPFERRIIHSALQESGLAVTKSEGEEGNRFVVIIPNRKCEGYIAGDYVSESSDRRSGERRDGDRRGGGFGGRGRFGGDRRGGGDRSQGRGGRRSNRGDLSETRTNAGDYKPNYDGNANGGYDPYASYESSINNFKKDGPRKVRSFGYKKDRF